MKSNEFTLEKEPHPTEKIDNWGRSHESVSSIILLIWNERVSIKAMSPVSNDCKKGRSVYFGHKWITLNEQWICVIEWRIIEFDTT